MLKTYDIPVSEIVPYAGNPRINKNAIDFVVKSIEDYCFRVPVVLDANNVIVAGHTRIEAAKKLGMKSVPCVIADDLTEEQIKAFRLADNKVAQLSTWDFERLETELDALKDAELIAELFEKVERQIRENAEIDLEDFADEQFQYECPCCGFRFNKS